MSHETLMNLYQTNFALIQHHKYSLEELENMVPFERDIYIALLVDFIKKENDRIKQQQNARRR